MSYPTNQHQAIVRSINLATGFPEKRIQPYHRKKSFMNQLKSKFEQWANAYTKDKMAEISSRLQQYHYRQNV